MQGDQTTAIGFDRRLERSTSAALLFGVAEIVARLVAVFLALAIIFAVTKWAFPLSRSFAEKFPSMMLFVLGGTLIISLGFRMRAYLSPVAYPGKLRPTLRSLGFFFAHSVLWTGYWMVTGYGFSFMLDTLPPKPLWSLSAVELLSFAAIWLVLAVAKLGSLVWYREEWLSANARLRGPNMSPAYLSLYVVGMFSLLGLIVFMGASWSGLLSPAHWHYLGLGGGLFLASEVLSMFWARRNPDGSYSYLSSRR